jgi:hypothetical protein
MCPQSLERNNAVCTAQFSAPKQAQINTVATAIFHFSSTRCAYVVIGKAHIFVIFLYIYILYIQIVNIVRTVLMFSVEFAHLKDENIGDPIDGLNNANNSRLNQIFQIISTFLV